MDDGLIAQRLGSWEAWAGNPATWPVTRRGADAVKWAVRVHREHLGDFLLERAIADDPPHPFVEAGRWPLTNAHAVLELLSRACTLSLLQPLERDSMVRRWQVPRVNRVVRSDLHVLEVAGWALGDGWKVVFESELQTGRRPDLLLRRAHDQLCVEVSSLGPDQVLRSTDRWHEAVVPALFAIGSRYGVDFSGSAGSTDLRDEQLERFLRAVEATAVQVASSGRPADVCAADVLVTLRSGGSGRSSFDGPPLTGDMWPKLERRLEDKALQTEGSAPAWIVLQDRSELFRITDLAAVGEVEQLRRLTHNVAVSMHDFPHVAGVVLSTGVRIDSTELDHETSLGADDLGGTVRSAVALRRRLPGGRCRRSFIVELGRDPAAPSAHPRRWLQNEGGWLPWALRAAGQAPLESVFEPSA